MQLIIQYIIYALLFLLSLFTIITLKFAFHKSYHIRKQNIHDSTQIIPSFKQNFKFLISKFTFAQIVLQRKSIFKFFHLLIIALLLLLSIQIQNSYLWAWSITTIFCTSLFILAQIVIFKNQNSNSTSQQQSSQKQINAYKIIIYIIYATVTIFMYVTVCYIVHYNQFNVNIFWRNFIVSICIDQFIAKPIFIFAICFIGGQSEYLLQLKYFYLLIDRSQQQIKKQKITSIQPVSPQHKKQQAKRISPTKIPAAINKSDIQQNFAFQSRPIIVNTSQNQSNQMNSLINFLQQSQKKKHSRAKFSVSGVINSITPKKKIKSHHKSLQNSIQFVQNQLKQTNFEDRYKSPYQNNNRSKSKNYNIQNGNVRIIQNMVNEGHQIKQFSNIMTKTNQLDNIQCKNYEQSQKTCKFRDDTFQDKQPIQFLNTLQNLSKQSRITITKKQNKSQSPKSVGTNHQNQHEADQPQENNNYRHKQFIIGELNYCNSQIHNPNFQNSIQSFDNLYGSNYNENFDQNNRYSLLQIKQQSQNQVQELSQLDLNTSLKIKNANQYNNYDEKNKKRNPSRSKKRPIRKRDIKQLKKIAGDSPYLQYLPNMLSKQIQSHKRLNNNKQGEEGIKRGRSTRRGSNHHSKPKLKGQVGNQNACPKICLEEDF